MVVGKYAFNLSLCLFETNTINSVLYGFTLSLLAYIHSFTHHLGPNVDPRQIYLKRRGIEFSEVRIEGSRQNKCSFFSLGGGGEWWGNLG